MTVLGRKAMLVCGRIGAAAWLVLLAVALWLPVALGGETPRALGNQAQRTDESEASAYSPGSAGLPEPIKTLLARSAGRPA